MVTPPSTLARNASGSNLDFDAFATTESVHASVRLDYRKTGAVTASLSTMFGTEPKQLGHTPAASLSRGRYRSAQATRFATMPDQETPAERYRGLAHQRPEIARSQISMRGSH